MKKSTFYQTTLPTPPPQPPKSDIRGSKSVGRVQQQCTCRRSKMITLFRVFAARRFAAKSTFRSINSSSYKRQSGATSHRDHNKIATCHSISHDEILFRSFLVQQGDGGGGSGGGKTHCAESICILGSWRLDFNVCVCCSDITNDQLGISGETGHGGANLYIY